MCIRDRGGLLLFLFIGGFLVQSREAVKASGYTVTFDGFTVLYEEATDEKEKKETALPPLEQGQVLKLHDLKSCLLYTSGSLPAPRSAAVPVCMPPRPCALPWEPLCASR